MMYQKSIVLAGVLAIGLVGCASTPPMEDLTQLSAEEVRETLVGSTWTSKHDWGNWAEYHPDESSGYAKAWGSWGEELASSQYTVSEEGEGCWVYSGDHDWSKPDQTYCSVLLVDMEGNLYAKSTQNPKPERVGQLTKIVMEQGDTKGLAP